MSGIIKLGDKYTIFICGIVDSNVLERITAQGVDSQDDTDDAELRLDRMAAIDAYLDSCETATDPEPALDDWIDGHPIIAAEDATDGDAEEDDDESLPVL